MIHFLKTVNFKPLVAAIICLLNITAAGQGKINAYQALFQTNPYLKHWAGTIPHFNLSAFKYTRTGDFENIILDDSWKENDPSFRQTFGKLISYSADKKKYLDFYSGQIVFDTLRSKGKAQLTTSMDVDQYLLLGEYATRKTTRLLFMGSSSFLEEAAWITDSMFILAGTTSEQNYYVPFIYIGDLKKRQFYCYLPDNKNIKRDTIYKSPKWKLLKGLSL
jgi:hypothetical protein